MAATLYVLSYESGDDVASLAPEHLAAHRDRWEEFRARGELLLIGRLAIAPDRQGEGLGSRLLEAVEERGRASGCREAELFTGSLSEANLRLYERLGYRETQRVPDGDGTAQVFLRKRLDVGAPE